MPLEDESKSAIHTIALLYKPILSAAKVSATNVSRPRSVELSLSAPFIVERKNMFILRAIQTMNPGMCATHQCVQCNRYGEIRSYSRVSPRRAITRKSAIQLCTEGNCLYIKFYIASLLCRFNNSHEYWW